MMGKAMAQPSNLDSMVRDRLREQILSGDLDGGYHLSELRLSKEFNVSRTPVREALCALAADGLVEMVPHRGAFVTHVPASTKADQMQSYGLLVSLTAKMAAERVTIEGLMDLETAFSFATEEGLKSDLYLNAINNALDMMERFAGSPTIGEAISSVRRRTDITAMWATALPQKKELNTHFLTLLAAIKRKKGDAAEKTMRQLASVAITAWMASRKMPVAAAPTETTDSPMVYSRTRAAQKALMG
jgi:DNA-binding GntR family transcriptional regulator